MSKSIVVADDDQDILALLVAVLEDAGFAVTPAVGKQTVETVEEQHPDLVMLDYNMPEMDGVQVARRIRSNAATRATPIVAMSAEYQVERVCRQMGADGCLPKPFEIDDLLAVVERPDHRTHRSRRYSAESRSAGAAVYAHPDG